MFILSWLLSLFEGPNALHWPALIFSYGSRYHENGRNPQVEVSQCRPFADDREQDAKRPSPHAKGVCLD